MREGELTMEDPYVLLAHAGASHWYDYVLWVGPLAVILGLLLRERWRMRRHGRDEGPGS